MIYAKYLTNDLSTNHSTLALVYWIQMEVTNTKFTTFQFTEKNPAQSSVDRVDFTINLGRNCKPALYLILSSSMIISADQFQALVQNFCRVRNDDSLYTFSENSFTHKYFAFSCTWLIPKTASYSEKKASNHFSRQFGKFYIWALLAIKYPKNWKTIPAKVVGSQITRY